MKGIILSVLMLFTTAQVFSQKLKEPEFVDEIAVVNGDSSITVMKTEVGDIKTKSTMFGAIPLPGTDLLDKVRSYICIKGRSSLLKLKRGKITFIARKKENDYDPKKIFGIISFKTTKKERRYQIGSTGILSGSAIKTDVVFSDIPYEVSKYREHSYLITVNITQPGEYAINSVYPNFATFTVE